MAAMALEKASLKIKDTGEEIFFSYNPAELSIAKSASWKSEPKKNGAPPKKKGKSAPSKQEFLGTNPRKLTMSVTFDARDPLSRNKNVVDAVQSLLGLTEATVASWGTTQPQPPIVLLHWGGGKWPFESFVDSVTAKYTLFAADGTPIRAQVQLSLTETPADADKQNPSSGGVAGRRSRVVAAGDSLQSIAYQEYGRPALWRALAGANAIDDPMRLAPGTRLLIPPRIDAERLA